MNLDLIRVIEFNGIKLPRFAHLLSVAPIVADSISPNAEEWFIFFSACVGHRKSDSSTNIIANCLELLTALQINPTQVKGKLRDRYPDVDPSAILRDWVSALGAMVEHAKGCETCSWLAPISKADATEAERRLRSAIGAFGLDPDEPTAL